MLTIKQIIFIIIAAFGLANTSFAQLDAALAARIVGNATTVEQNTTITSPQSFDHIVASIRQERLKIVRQVIDDPAAMAASRRTEGNATQVPQIEQDSQRRFGQVRTGQVRFGGTGNQTWTIVQQGEQNYLACFHKSLAVVEVPEERIPQNLRRPGRTYYAQICAGQQFPQRDNDQYRNSQYVANAPRLSTLPVTHSVITWITVDDPNGWKGVCTSPSALEAAFNRAYPTTEDNRRFTEEAKRRWRENALIACAGQEYVLRGLTPTAGYTISPADDDFRLLVDRRLGDRVRVGIPSEQSQTQDDPCDPDNAFGPVGGCSPRGAGARGDWRQYDPRMQGAPAPVPGGGAPFRPMPYGVPGGGFRGQGMPNGAYPAR